MSESYARELAALEEVSDVSVNVNALTSEHTFELVMLKLAGWLVAARDAEDIREAHTIESTLTEVAGAFDAVQLDQQDTESEGA